VKYSFFYVADDEENTGTLSIERVPELENNYWKRHVIGRITIHKQDHTLADIILESIPKDRSDISIEDDEEVFEISEVSRREARKIYQAVVRALKQDLTPKRINGDPYRSLNDQFCFPFKYQPLFSYSAYSPPPKPKKERILQQV